MKLSPIHLVPEDFKRWNDLESILSKSFQEKGPLQSVTAMFSYRPVCVRSKGGLILQYTRQQLRIAKSELFFANRKKSFANRKTFLHGRLLEREEAVDPHLLLEEKKAKEREEPERQFPLFRGNGDLLLGGTQWTCPLMGVGLS